MNPVLAFFAGCVIGVLEFVGAIAFAITFHDAWHHLPSSNPMPWSYALAALGVLALALVLFVLALRAARKGEKSGAALTGLILPLIPCVALSAPIAAFLLFGTKGVA